MQFLCNQVQIVRSQMYDGDKLGFGKFYCLVAEISRTLSLIFSDGFRCPQLKRSFKAACLTALMRIGEASSVEVDTILSLLPEMTQQVACLGSPCSTEDG